MDFSIVNLSKPNCPYWRCVDDVSLPLYHALASLNYKVEILSNAFSPRSVNIIFGLQDLPDLDLDIIPKNSIIYNFEQISANSKGARPHYLQALKEFEVWEYSLRNLSKLKQDYGVKNITYVPLGYVPEMTRIDPDFPKDIDALLYGYPNERRIKIIKELQACGIKAVLADKVFGAERDFLIARSKILLNIHYYTPGILEVVRLSYLLANKKTIISEFNSDTEMREGYEDSCIFCPYESLVNMTSSVLSNAKLCKLQAEKGYERFVSNNYQQTLQEILGSPVYQVNMEKIPKRINAGSGKDFKLDYLNIDISPKWNPDLLLDLSQPLDSEKVFSSRRFGEFSFKKGYFEQIIANDVIEHVPDLEQTMTNFLELLCDGGELKLSVPYDLSLGAWQDPTHLRAFNENSWKYYTEWAWYLGWKEWRFELKELEYELSEKGRKKHAQGLKLEEILATPRAVDSMLVVLKKRKSTPAELLEYEKRHHTFYITTVSE